MPIEQQIPTLCLFCDVPLRYEAWLWETKRGTKDMSIVTCDCVGCEVEGITLAASRYYKVDWSMYTKDAAKLAEVRRKVALMEVVEA